MEPSSVLMRAMCPGAWQALTAEQRHGFPPLPDLVVELASPSDEGPAAVSALAAKVAAFKPTALALLVLSPTNGPVEICPPPAAGPPAPGNRPRLSSRAWSFQACAWNLGESGSRKQASQVNPSLGC